MEVGQRAIAGVPPGVAALAGVPAGVAIAHVGGDEVAFASAAVGEERSQLRRLGGHVEVRVAVLQHVAVRPPPRRVQPDPRLGSVLARHRDEAAAQPSQRVGLPGTVGRIRGRDRRGDGRAGNAALRRIAPEVRLDVHEGGGGPDPLQQEAVVGEVARHHAVVPTVQEIDAQADGQPDAQPQPILRW